MKKTSLIILTLVASLSITLGSAQGDPGQLTHPPEFLFEPEAIESDTTKNDTLKTDTVKYYYPQQYGYYDYYYRNRFFNSVFRIFFPGRYYRLVNQPGFVPHNVRGRRSDLQHVQTGKHPARSSGSRRGGFGHSGVTHTQSN